MLRNQQTRINTAKITTHVQTSLLTPRATRYESILVQEELHEAMKTHYEENKQDLLLKGGIRSLTAFMNYFSGNGSLQGFGENLGKIEIAEFKQASAMFRR